MIANFLLDSRKGGPHFVLDTVKKKIKNVKKRDFYLDKKKKIFFLFDIIINSLIIFCCFKKYNFFFIYSVYNLAPVFGGLLSNKIIFWFILENPNFLGKIILRTFTF